MNQENVDLIIKTAAREGLLRNQLAYVLATGEWETNRTMEPVREAYYLKAKAESYRKKLRYYPWYGRGLVQLTWEENYKKAGVKIGVNLIANPDLAMEPRNAVEILVQGMKYGWFTGKKLSDYITLSTSGFTNARRIINGIDKAKEIAELAREWDAKLKAEGYGTVQPKPAVPFPTDIKPEPEVIETHEEPIAPPAKVFNWLPWAVGAVLALIALWLLMNWKF